MAVPASTSRADCLLVCIGVAGIGFVEVGLAIVSFVHDAGTATGAARSAVILPFARAIAAWTDGLVVFVVGMMGALHDFTSGAAGSNAQCVGAFIDSPRGV